MRAKKERLQCLVIAVGAGLDNVAVYHEIHFAGTLACDQAEDVHCRVDGPNIRHGAAAPNCHIKFSVVLAFKDAQSVICVVRVLSGNEKVTVFIISGRRKITDDKEGQVTCLGPILQAFGAERVSGPVESQTRLTRRILSHIGRGAGEALIADQVCPSGYHFPILRGYFRGVQMEIQAEGRGRRGCPRTLGTLTQEQTEGNDEKKS